MVVLEGVVFKGRMSLVIFIFYYNLCLKLRMMKKKDSVLIKVILVNT